MRPGDPPLPSHVNEPLTPRHVAFVFRLGEALHRYGAPAHRLEEVLASVTAKLGVDARFYVTPTAIFATVGPPEVLGTSFVRVPPGDMDLGRLVELDALSMALIHDRISFPEAARQLERILEAKPLYSGLVTLLAYAVGAGAAARLFGGAAHEVQVALFAGLGVGLVALLAPRMAALHRIQEAVSGAVAALVAALGAAFVTPLSVELTTLGALLPLLPGLTLTVALTELTTRNLMSGTARLANAVTILLQLAFGVALGNRVGTLFVETVASPPPAPHGWSFAPAFVFTTVALVVLMRGRPRDLWMMALTAGAGYAGTRLGAPLLGPELGAFLGALAAAMTSNALARLVDKPAVVPLVPALLLLVPGSIGLKSLNSLYAHDVIAGLHFAFSTTVMLVSLVAGLLLANVIVRPNRAL